MGINFYPEVPLARHLRLQPTREGKRLILVILVLALAALNTGNNLMYLILAMTLSIGLLSIVLPILNLSGLETTLQMPESVFAGTKATVRLVMRNTKAISSFSLRVRVGFISPDGLYIKKVPPGREMTITEEVFFPRRGIYELRHLNLSTSFPFVFFVFSRDIPFQGKLIVYPELLHLEDNMIEDLFAGTTQATLKAQTGDYPQSMRRYIEGDPLRHIHWKATAKLGDLIVKEFYRERTEKVTLVLDNSGRREDELFERTVSIGATVLVGLAETDLPFRLITSRKAFPFGTGRAHLMLQLDHLAGIMPEGVFESRLSEEEEGPVILVAPRKGGLLERYLDARVVRAYYASCL